MSAFDHTMLRSILQEQFVTLPPAAREIATNSAIRKVNESLASHQIPSLPSLPAADAEQSARQIRELRENGITLLGPILDKGQLADIHRHLHQCKMYGSHVWGYGDRIPRSKKEIAQDKPQGCHLLEDSLRAPHLAEIVASPAILKLAEGFLGATPTIFQTNLMWSFAKPSAGPAVAQAFHRDWDNFRFCVLFIYLTDVDRQHGPHQYVRGSAQAEKVQAAIDRYHQTDPAADLRVEGFFQEESAVNKGYTDKVFANDIVQIEEPAGYAFMADAFGLHRGLPLLEGERLLFWTRFGLYDNGFSADVTPAPLERDFLKGRIPDDATHRYIFRALVESEFTDMSFRRICDDLIARYGRRRFVSRAVTEMQSWLRRRLQLGEA